jgi:2',3'-cyclic-nucleotide 2'-phosphodiesterase (5'-nucleotidase family)
MKIPMLFGSWALGLTLAAQAAVVPPRMDKAVSTPVGATVPDDAEIAKYLAPISEKIHATFGRVLGTSPKGIGKATRLGDNPLGFFLADVMREGARRAVKGEVRFAFTNTGGLRRNIPPGEVRVQDIYEVLPFDNELVIAEYTGAEVVQIIKEGIQRKGGEPCSGARSSVTGTPAEPVVSITWSDGSAIDPAATYKVATTDYLLANGDGTPTLKIGRNVQLTGVPVRQLVIDVCDRLGKEHKPIQPEEGARYIYSPEILEALKASTFRF